MHQIGVGVLGPLFRAVDATGSVVAVKAFRLDLTPEQVERFASALHDVIGVDLSEPSIVPLLDAGIDAGIPYLVSEYVAGNSLDVVLRNASGRPARAPEIIAGVAAAVDAAHEVGVMHGALHLRDVMVDGARVSVSGFGVANVLEHVGLRVPIRRPYAAPEIVAGRHWGSEADRYAIAAIAYELLTGLRAAGSADELVSRLRDLAGVHVADRAALQQAFRNGLADDPSLRPASAGQFVVAFTSALGTTAPVGENVAPFQEPDAFVAADPLDLLDEPEPPSSATDPFELVPESASPQGSGVFPLGWTRETAVPGETDGPQGAGGTHATTIGTNPVEQDDERLADSHAAHEAVDRNVVPPPRAGRPSSQQFVLRSAAPVAVAMVIGIGLAYILGIELGGPGETVSGMPGDARPVADNDAEPELPRPEPEQGVPLPTESRVAPPAAVDVLPEPANEVAAIVEAAPEPEVGVPLERVDPAPAPAASTGPGSVYVDTRPPGATVVIDGEPVGVTPILVPDVGAGVHQMRIELAGYSLWVTDVSVTTGEQIRVGASLRPDEQ